jgi:signal transduction histidine kinase
VQYVASIGGDIQVASDPGAGTRVRVRLPRSDAPAAAGASADTEQIAQ